MKGEGVRGGGEWVAIEIKLIEQTKRDAFSYRLTY